MGEGDKTVPLADLVKYKSGAENREKKLKEDLARLQEQLAAEQGLRRKAESDAKMAKANLSDDDEVAKVRQMLIDQDKEYQEKIKKHESDLASLTKREREVRAKELMAEYGAKGVKIDAESLQNVDDLEGHFKEAYVAHLAKENEELKQKSPAVTPESVFERGTGGVLKKTPADMTTQEFDQFYEAQKKEALSKL